ncbi:hypothetical protein BHE74_00029206 [Ensete ventricosum]|nr:hypothetical protein BHE74_00029206 [Ensete ventricosum]
MCGGVHRKMIEKLTGSLPEDTWKFVGKLRAESSIRKKRSLSAGPASSSLPTWDPRTPRPARGMNRRHWSSTCHLGRGTLLATPTRVPVSCSAAPFNPLRCRYNHDER